LVLFVHKKNISLAFSLPSWAVAFVEKKQKLLSVFGRRLTG